MDHSDTQCLLNRRRFLTSSQSGLGLLALSSLLQQDGLLAAPAASAGRTDPLAPKAPHFAPRAKRCLFIFLIGGTSQMDMWDPKPELNRLHGQKIPDSFREGVRLGQTSYDAPLMGCPFGFRRYGRSGMEMSELLPHLGAHADDLTLIRSMHHEAFDHAPGELVLATGKDQPGRPTLGSWLAYGLGSESRDLPGYVVLLNGRAPKARRLSWGSGFLPASYEGVLLRSQGSPILDLKTPDGISPAANRVQLDAVQRLNGLRQERTRDPKLDAQIAAYELAFRMQTAAPELIDTSRESAGTRESYGDGDFGRGLLLGRRLLERGVRFVTVTHHEWDHHEAIHADLPRVCKEIDRPIGTLLNDLKQRGMLEDTLVVCGTEFGRTAITQGKDFAKAGRDHHPHAFSVWLAGAGVKQGQVLGATDDLGWRPTQDPVHIHDFHATLLHLFGLDHKRLTFRYQGLDMRLTDVAGNVVKKILA
ncbi:MAG: hypothetical protein K0Q72_1838 [Armatimonadetes bacterium]|nr:hypothetical protein [Armatimonadota bacterium]